MTKPKMILFDYGQTLVNEAKFNGVKGTRAVLKYATKNKYNRTAEEIQAVADTMNQELALEKADLKPEEVWYIGDNYECDIEGARNAGLFPVWYVGATENPTEQKAEILMVDSWEKLKNNLEK